MVGADQNLAGGCLCFSIVRAICRGLWTADQMLAVGESPTRNIWELAAVDADRHPQHDLGGADTDAADLAQPAPRRKCRREARTA